jgi:hypothetical protein
MSSMKKLIIFCLADVAVVLSFLTGCKEDTLPTVTTKAVTNIAQTTVTSGGNIVSDGGASITSKGICWTTTENPTSSDATITFGAGNEEFTATIIYLTPATAYHVRAFAINSVGTAYGKDVLFSTLGKPKMSTIAASEITSTSATCGGNVISDGGAAVTERGICFSTGDFPTIFDTKIISGSGTGTYYVNLTDLSPGTKYYIRAYAINSVGTGYANILNFTTPEK